MKKVSERPVFGEFLNTKKDGGKFLEEEYFVRMVRYMINKSLNKRYIKYNRDEVHA